MTTANNSSYVPFLKDADLEKEGRATAVTCTLILCGYKVCGSHISLG